jgi:SAM-dependent methyltransferase
MDSFACRARRGLAIFVCFSLLANDGSFAAPVFSTHATPALPAAPFQTEAIVSAFRSALRPFAGAKQAQEEIRELAAVKEVSGPKTGDSPDEVAIVRKTVDGYNKIAPIYAAKWQQNVQPEVEVLLLRFLGHLPFEGRIVDAGTGPGQKANWFSIHGRDVIGIDLSDEMLHHAKRAFPHILFGKGGLDQLPVKTGSVAGIWDDGAFHHLPPGLAEKAADEYLRALRPDGIVSILIKEGSGPEIVNDQRYQGMERYFNRYTETRLCDLFLRHGFDIVDSGTQQSSGGQHDYWVYIMARPKAGTETTSAVATHFIGAQMGTGWVKTVLRSFWALTGVTPIHEFAHLAGAKLLGPFHSTSPRQGLGRGTFRGVMFEGEVRGIEGASLLLGALANFLVAALLTGIVGAHFHGAIASGAGLALFCLALVHAAAGLLETFHPKGDVRKYFRQLRESPSAKRFLSNNKFPEYRSLSVRPPSFLSLLAGRKQAFRSGKVRSFTLHNLGVGILVASAIFISHAFASLPSNLWVSVGVAAAIFCLSYLFLNHRLAGLLYDLKTWNTAVSRFPATDDDIRSINLQAWDGFKQADIYRANVTEATLPTEESSVEVMEHPTLGRVVICDISHLVLVKQSPRAPVAVASLGHMGCTPMMLRAVDSAGQVWIGHVHLWAPEAQYQLCRAEAYLRTHGFSSIQVRIIARREGAPGMMPIYQLDDWLRNHGLQGRTETYPSDAWMDAIVTPGGSGILSINDEASPRLFAAWPSIDIAGKSSRGLVSLLGAAGKSAVQAFEAVQEKFAPARDTTPRHSPDLQCAA